MVETADSEGNQLILVTNRFDLTCDEFSDMHHSRWAIETFFKWMKQHLRLKRFYGTMMFELLDFEQEKMISQYSD